MVGTLALRVLHCYQCDRQPAAGKVPMRFALGFGRSSRRMEEVKSTAAECTDVRTCRDHHELACMDFEGIPVFSGLAGSGPRLPRCANRGNAASPSAQAREASVLAMRSSKQPSSRGLRVASLTSCLYLVSCLCSFVSRLPVLTVVPLRDSVLYPPPLCQIRNLCPVFIGICASTEGAACPRVSVVCGSRHLRIDVARVSPLHSGSN